MPDPPRPPPELEPYPPARQAWYVVGVLMVVYLFSFLDRTIINLLVEPIKDDLGLTDTLMSLLMGPAFAILYTLFGLPIGRLADSRSRKLIIAAGLGFWSLATAGCGLARRYWHLLVMRIGVGVGEATLSPSAYSMITDLFPLQRLTFALSVYSVGIYLGAGISVLVGGLVSEFAMSQGPVLLPVLGEVRAWQIVFLIIGLLGAVPLLILAATVREPLRRGLKTGDRSIPLRVIGDYVWRQRRTVLCHHLAHAALAFSGYGVGGWALAFMMRVHGWSFERVGILLGLHTAITGSVSLLVGGAFTDWLSRKGYRDAKMRIGLIAALAWFPTGVLYPLVPNGNLAFALMIPTLLFAGLATGAGPAAVQEIMPNRMRGQASALYLFVVNLVGLGLGPTGVALATDYLFGDEMKLGYSMALVGVVCHSAAALLFWRGLRPYVESADAAQRWQMPEGDGRLAAPSR